VSFAWLSALDAISLDTKPLLVAASSGCESLCLEGPGCRRVMRQSNAGLYAVRLGVPLRECGPRGSLGLVGVDNSIGRSHICERRSATTALDASNEGAVMCIICVPQVCLLYVCLSMALAKQLTPVNDDRSARAPTSVTALAAPFRWPGCAAMSCEMSCFMNCRAWPSSARFACRRFCTKSWQLFLKAS